MYEELKALDKLPFLTNVELGPDFVELTYKPTCMRMDKFRRGDHSGEHGRRIAYLGAIKFKITPTKINLSRKRNDTRRIIFRVTEKGGNVNIASWTGFKLTVDPAKAPIDAANNVMNLTGTVVDAVNGRVGFTPTGSTVIGDYFYDAEAIDDNSEKVTFAEGSYEITQDITK